MQSALLTLIGRLFGFIDRKNLVVYPFLIIFSGAVVSAKATSTIMLVGGRVLIGATLSSISRAGDAVQSATAQVVCSGQWLRIHGEE